MISYSAIEKHCETNNKLSRVVIDNFLIHYAAGKEGLVPIMDAALKRYKRAARDIPETYINFLKSEYIAHRIFSKNGFISKYLERPEFRNLPKEQYEYLEFQAQNPWRLSFAEIRNNLETAFFEMEDIMTGEQYLLYSPGMKATEDEKHPLIWFNLIAYNGQCWQSFGLIIPFKSFTADDIFFFATELNPKIEDEDMLMSEVQRNPFPFLMLLSTSDAPQVVSRGYEILTCQSIDELKNFSTYNFQKDFYASWNKDVYQLTLNELGEFPHFAVAYYHEKRKELIRTAMTEYGFERLTEVLANGGIDLNSVADLVVSPTMISAAGLVLNKSIELNPYEKLFSKKEKDEDSEDLKRINNFLKLAIPAYNDGREIDLKVLAREAGIDQKTASALWKQLKKTGQRK